MTGTRASGQATVELVAAIPLAVAIVLAVVQLLAAGVARELAGHAAEAGAMALLQGADAERAAREAVPTWSRARIAVTVDGRVVRVHLRPPAIVPATARLLTARAAADAGPG